MLIAGHADDCDLFLEMFLIRSTACLGCQSSSTLWTVDFLKCFSNMSVFLLKNTLSVDSLLVIAHTLFSWVVSYTLSVAGVGVRQQSLNHQRFMTIHKKN